MTALLAIGSFIGWIGAGLFLVIYHRNARWWRHGYGRSLFALMSIVFLVYTSSTLFGIFGPDYVGRIVLRSVIALGTPVVIWYLLITLVRGVVQARREREGASNKNAP